MIVLDPQPTNGFSAARASLEVALCRRTPIARHTVEHTADFIAISSFLVVNARDSE
jgi:hypothetical protein